MSSAHEPGASRPSSRAEMECECDHCGNVLTNSRSAARPYPNGTRPAVEMPRTLIESDALTVSFVSEAHIPTSRGCFRMRAYRDSSSGTEPIALIAGRITPDNAEGVPTRVHDSCFTSEVIGSLKCDCKAQLDYALEYIQREQPGVLVYLQQEGRGIGLANKILAYALQEHGVDTVDANVKLGFESDARQYLCVPHILRDCGVKSVKLMTNNPRKIERLRALDVVVSERIPIVVDATPHSEHYLKTKASRMGHLLPFPEKGAGVPSTLAVPATPLHSSHSPDGTQQQQQTSRSQSDKSCSTSDAASTTSPLSSRYLPVSPQHPHMSTPHAFSSAGEQPTAVPHRRRAPSNGAAAQDFPTIHSSAPPIQQTSPLLHSSVPSQIVAVPEARN